jgi:lysophospholipase L1-like esterase
MDPDIPARYQNNPLLVILENYVLHSIGHFPEDKTAAMAEVITTTFGGTDWTQTLRKEFDLPDNTDQTLTQMWQQRQEEAQETQTEITPEQFAQEAVDTLFADLGE